MQNDAENYVNTLSTLEKKALDIAQEHLGSSFCLIKSNGFLEWIAEKEKRKNEK
jgi:hypothetical protein